MNKNRYNILITINSGYAKYAVVMLTSLFENNQGCFHIYCLYNELDKRHKILLKETVKKYDNAIHFIQVDRLIYKDFPTTQNLTVECYFILLAHKMLPQNMDKILYLDSDTIIESGIDELYDTDFDNQYMVVCGQSYHLIEGHFYGIGARPELGQCFNSGVILFNLQMFREHISAQTYLEKAQEADYHFFEDQGILNIIFANKVKYVDTLKYNFRISIYEDYIRDGNHKRKERPVIIHYVMHDYYGVGYGCKPWKLTLNRQEYNLLLISGIINKKYDLQEADRMNFWMQERWWFYAKKTRIYYELKQEMEKEKKKLLKVWLFKDTIQTIQKIYDHQKENSIFKKITEGKFDEISDKIKNIQYESLEKYIDSISADSAIATMRNLFKHNCEKLKKEEIIKIAFVVYSSAEWQCEKLYRLLEKDNRFQPIIVVCAYSHGTDTEIRNTYNSTCKYFRQSEEQYHIEYAGYCDRRYQNKVLDAFQILVYISPYNVLRPQEINMSQRNITQLCVHIPYSYYLTNKKDKYYDGLYYEQIMFKMCWFYFCPNKLELRDLTQRMRGYNIQVSGMPKIDDLLEHTFREREKLWKNSADNMQKIIWAPHFNLRKGMNGTFRENYRWFYEYAKGHQEISWIVRPHPRMEWGVLEFGVFKSGAEYERYLEMWNELPNANVIKDGDYYDIFMSSDAMILDSVSFIAEYQYTGKPLLILEPEEPRSLNELGKALRNISYRARGNDFEQIQKFIKNVAKGYDPMKIERDAFRKQYLDYKTDTKKSATEYIYLKLEQSIFGN